MGTSMKSINVRHTEGDTLCCSMTRRQKAVGEEEKESESDGEATTSSNLNLKDGDLVLPDGKREVQGNHQVQQVRHAGQSYAPRASQIDRTSASGTSV